MHPILKQINEIESLIPKREMTNEKVSKSTVGWQIGHSLKVINSVIKTLGKSNPTEYKWKFSLKRLVIFSLGYIPRGAGKAPKEVKPTEEELAEAELKVLIGKVRERLDSALKGDPKTFIIHPIFGALNRDQAMRFLVIHTEHHLKIARDIVR